MDESASYACGRRRPIRPPGGSKGPGRSHATTSAGPAARKLAAASGARPGALRQTSPFCLSLGPAAFSQEDLPSSPLISPHLPSQEDPSLFVVGLESGQLYKCSTTAQSARSAEMVHAQRGEVPWSAAAAALVTGVPAAQYHRLKQRAEKDAVVARERQATPRPDLRRTSPVPPPHLRRTSRAPRPHLARTSTAPPARQLR